MRREGGFTFSDLEQGYQGVCAGDLVFHGLDGFAGAFGVAAEGGRCTPVYHVMNCPDDEPRYLAYALRVAAEGGLLSVQVPSTRQRAVDFRNWSTLAPVRLPRPPRETQCRIADLLDDQCALLDRLAEAKRQQCSLVFEQCRARLAGITFAEGVLRQPCPVKSSAHFVDPFAISPPTGWTRYRLRNLLRKRSAPQRSDSLLSVFLDRGVIPFADAGPDRVHNPSLDLSAYQQVCVGDLVMNNQQAWRGSVGVSGFDGIVSPAYHVYAINRALLVPEWANLAFRSQSMVFLYEQVSRGVGSIQRNLDGSGLLSVPICIPTRDVQEQAAAQAHEVTEATQVATESLDRSADLLHEYRRSLIAAAVCGQFDVASAGGRGVSA